MMASSLYEDRHPVAGRPPIITSLLSCVTPLCYCLLLLLIPGRHSVAATKQQQKAEEAVRRRFLERTMSIVVEKREQGDDHGTGSSEQLYTPTAVWHVHEDSHRHMMLPKPLAMVCQVRDAGTHACMCTHVHLQCVQHLHNPMSSRAPLASRYHTARPICTRGAYPGTFDSSASVHCTPEQTLWTF